MKGEQHLWRVLNDKLDTLLVARQFKEAVRVAQSALELARRSFAPSDPQLAFSYERLALAHEQNGDRAAAKALLVSAHAVLEKAEPLDQVALFNSARRLARLCEELGDVNGALAFYEKAVAAESPDVPYSERGTLLNNAALLFRKIGHPKAAEQSYLRALKTYEEHLSPEHPNVAAVLNNLGVLYTSEKRFAEAEMIHQRALGIREKQLPQRSAEIAQSRCNLAVVYHSRGDYDRAAQLYRGSLEMWEKTGEPPTHEYDVVVSNYGDLLQAIGKKREAHALQTRARKKRGR